MCSEFPAEVKDKEKRGKVDEDIVESGEVISVCKFNHSVFVFNAKMFPNDSL